MAAKACSIECSLVYDQLQLGNQCNPPESYRFRAPLGDGWYLSIIVDPRSMGNRKCDDGLPHVLETALVKGDEYVNVPDWGYDGPIRFWAEPRASHHSNIKKVRKEILRLAPLVESHK